MNIAAAEPHGPATYQDVIDAPENMVAEIIDGWLHLQPRPRPRHAIAIATLAGDLVRPFGRGIGGPGGWVIMVEPELHFGADVLVPDLAGWRRERMPKVPEEVGITIAPDWVCEVLSPSTRRLDLTRKRQKYADNAVAHLWFVDPMDETLEAFVLKDGAWSLVGAASGDAIVESPPFDAVKLELGALWAD